MSGRHGRCPVHSRCSENAGGPLPLTGRSVGWTFTANWDCKSVAPVWGPCLNYLLAFINWESLPKTLNFQLYFESSWVLATVVCVAHSAPPGWGRCGCPHRGTGAVRPAPSLRPSCLFPSPVSPVGPTARSVSVGR